MLLREVEARGDDASLVGSVNHQRLLRAPDVVAQQIADDALAARMQRVGLDVVIRRCSRIDRLAIILRPSIGSRSISSRITDLAMCSSSESASACAKTMRACP